jgi:quinol monooxygenase YgiN
MTDRIVILIEFLVHEGKDAASDTHRQSVLDTIDQNNTEITYDFYRNPAEPRKIVALESHPDSTSLIKHLQRTMPLLQKTAESADMVRIEIYGNVTPELADILDKMGVKALPFWHGR